MMHFLLHLLEHRISLVCQLRFEVTSLTDHAGNWPLAEGLRFANRRCDIIANLLLRLSMD